MRTASHVCFNKTRSLITPRDVRPLYRICGTVQMGSTQFMPRRQPARIFCMQISTKLDNRGENSPTATWKWHLLSTFIGRFLVNPYNHRFTPVLRNLFRCSNSDVNTSPLSLKNVTTPRIVRLPSALPKTYLSDDIHFWSGTDICLHWFICRHKGRAHYSQQICPLKCSVQRFSR